MGGKKKLTLKQMQRASEKKEEKEKEKRGTKPTTAPTERKAPGIVPPDPKSEKIISELKKMKALTPYTVATRFNLRLSVAKDMLDELAQRGVIEYVSGSKNLKIYKPHD